MRVVLDTNILARAASGPPGQADELLRLCLAPPHVLCLSPFLLGELARVLRYPRVSKVHGMSDDQIDGFLLDLQAGSLLVALPPAAVDTVVSADPDDDPIIALLWRLAPRFSALWIVIYISRPLLGTVLKMASKL